MDEYGQLYVLLNRIFNYTSGLEQKYLSGSEFKNISVNDMHILEAIGSKTSRNMSAVAKKVGVTVGTLTIAMNNLVKKGYVMRERSVEDRRVVLVSLSDLGEKALKYQNNFQRKLQQLLEGEIAEAQCEDLVLALNQVEKQFLKILKEQGDEREND